MAEPFEEKRRFPRIRSENLVFVEPLEAPSAIAKTRDVSLGGCSFLFPDPIDAGTILKLFLTMRGRIIETEARVVYQRPFDPDRLEIGVEFTQVSPMDGEGMTELFEPDLELRP